MDAIRVERHEGLVEVTLDRPARKNAIDRATWAGLDRVFTEVAKVTGAEWDEWRAANPEAFARPYDPASGLRFEAWVVQEGGVK